MTVAVVVVLLACVLVDGGTRWWLEARLADRLAVRLAERLPDARVQDVRVAGASALVAVLARSLDVDVDLLVPVDAIAERLEGADAGDAAARLPDGVTWGVAGGQVLASLDLRRAGLAVPVDVAISLAVDDGVLVATPTSVVAAGVQVPIDRAADRLPERLAALTRPRVVAARLPEGLRLVDVDVRADGIVLRASALDVPLPP